MKNDDRRGDSYRGNRDGRGQNRRPYGENRFDGPGRRTYGDRNEREARNGRDRFDPRDDRDGRETRGGRDRFDPRGDRDGRETRGGYDRRGPRVGRIADGVPRAQQVIDKQDTGKKPYQGGSRNRGADLHRGGAYRTEAGPRDGRERRFPGAADDEVPELTEALAAEFTDAAEDGHLLAGRNPIREALKAGRPMEKLLVAAGDLSGAGREIIQMARNAGVVVQQVERQRLDQIYPAHQGMLACVAAVPYTPLEDIVAAARAKGEDPFVIVLDGITDPHNLGAIIRSAECAGAHGVVIPERRAAGLSPATAKAAAGALNHMPVARVKNLNRAIEALKAEGLWIIGTVMDGEDALSAELTGPVALVIGSEGDGVSRLTLEKCDRTVSLPMKGHIESLNASVAAGILMYQILRQRAR